MSKLEDLQPNAAVRSILPDALVTVVSVQWFGSEALELTSTSGSAASCASGLASNSCRIVYALEGRDAMRVGTATVSMKPNRAPKRRQWQRLPTAALWALSLTPLACGDDGVIFFQTNFGIVGSDATCRAGGGQFPLDQQSGLIVVVILDGNSKIVLANGASGQCADVRAGTHVSVDGSNEHGQIQASEVRLLQS